MSKPMSNANEGLPAAACSVVWVETRKDRWDRSDGAVVKIDHTVECSTSRPWLPNYRGWKAWGPGENDLLGFKRRCTRLRRSRFVIARKFKTAQSAMKAVDAEYPPNVKGMAARSEGDHGRENEDQNHE